ncbi:MAG: PAS domain S-box protein [Spirochaetales bacterium]|jgi:PAS domain S-box-containing protein|nr:PAS domain S-box protein [Spirochaetales bacterium]
MFSTRNNTRQSVILVVMILTAVVMATMTYSLLSSTKMVRQHTHLVDAAMEIKLETALSHLWLEEIISGDKNENIDKVWQHLDQALWYAQALLKGGEGVRGVIIPLHDAELNVAIMTVVKKITEFRSLAKARCSAIEQSGIATLSDQRFDTVFRELLHQTDQVETVLKAVMARDLRKFRITLGLLIGLCLGLFTLTGIAFLQYERRNTRHLKLLKESESRFKIFFHSANDAIFVHPLQDDGFAPFTEINPIACSRYGYTREEFLQLSVPDITKKDDQNNVISPALRCRLHETKHLIFEAVHLTKSGQEIPVEINTNIIDLGDGTPLFLSVVRDISDRKQAEIELATEKERLAVTLRSIGDGVITTDINGRVVFLNKIAEELSGWTNTEAQGELSTNVFNIINEKTGQKCVSPVQRVIELGRIIGLANHTALIAKDGSIRSIADSGAPIRDLDSKIIGVVIVFRDVTHEQKMTDELLKIRKLESVGVLAGGIAHDFNNILAAILGNIELACYRLNKDDSETVALLSNAKNATQRATKLTGQLLTFSKGGDPIKKETALPELINESADFVTHGSKIKCQYTFPDNLWTVEVDSGQIGQVIQNIIINAKHALPQGGTVSIACANVQDAATEALLSVDDGNYVRITIQDTGVGIPKEIIDKIFDPYFTTKQEGSGLGLAICHSIINKHDGHITAESPPGKGTNFTRYLPAVSSLDSTESAQKKKPKPAAKASRILLMDDEKMIRDLVQSQLSNLGHEAVLAIDGEQAINKYQELQDNGNPVDLVIMDLTIPGGMGGQEAAQKLLLIDPKAKIIVASGYSNDPVMAHYRDYGFCAAVAKPFDLKELNNAINSALL